MSRLLQRLSLQRARAPRRGVAAFALLAWIFLSQTLLIVHRIDHASAGEGVSCSLCVAADHLAAAVTDVQHTFDAPVTTPVVATLSVARRAPTLLSYRSRAPPDNPLA